MNLNGTIPTSIGSMTSLSKITIQHNQLNGDIPNGMYNLSLSTCNLAPQDTTSGGFTCPYPVHSSCIFGRTDVCTDLVSDELTALNDLEKLIQTFWMDWISKLYMEWSSM